MGDCSNTVTALPRGGSSGFNAEGIEEFGNAASRSITFNGPPGTPGMGLSSRDAGPGGPGGSENTILTLSAGEISVERG
jgi:hypothetical protein